jgi:hypothetical protein
MGRVSSLLGRHANLLSTAVTAGVPGGSPPQRPTRLAVQWPGLAYGSETASLGGMGGQLVKLTTQGPPSCALPYRQPPASHPYLAD